MIHDEEAQNIKITIQSCLQNHVSIPNKLNYVHETWIEFHNFQVS